MLTDAGIERTKRATHSDIIRKSPGVGGGVGGEGVSINPKLVWQLTFLSFRCAFL